MNSFLLSVLLLSFSIVSAQQSYPLHPSIGDTIDRNEKLDYSLFPAVANQDFKFAIIEFAKDSFFLAISNSNTSVIKTKFLSKEELIEAQKTIETGKGELSSEILKLNELAIKLRDERFKKGSIAFDRIEIKFNIDGKQANRFQSTLNRQRRPTS